MSRSIQYCREHEKKDFKLIGVGIIFEELLLKNAMRKYILILLFVLVFGSSIEAQEWMRSLDIAQKLALVQNKMILMVWEDSTYYDYPVAVQNNRGRYLIIPNLFSDEKISPLIWKNFIPVIVSEDEYHDLFIKIKDKRRQAYIDKFNDDSIKIMDVNGNILNVTPYVDGIQDITRLIERYALSTDLISNELKNYYNDKNFYSAFFLASKYLDLALYARKNTRSKLIDLSNIYLEEAKRFVKSESLEGDTTLLQRCELLKIQEYLVDERPNKVLRELKKLSKIGLAQSNDEFFAFLKYTAHASLAEEDEATLWKTKVSSLNLKKAEKIINLNI